MIKKTFKLKLLGYKNEIVEVTSTDYNEDLGLVRYKDAIYDWETGLWAIKLAHIKFKSGTWKWYDAIPNCSMSTLLSTVINNKDWLSKLEYHRSKCDAPILNKKERNLFDL